MKTVKILNLILFCLLGLAHYSSAQNQKTAKKRVAVFLFEDKSGGNQRWYGNKGVGEGVTDMITTELVKSGNYTVIEREQLDALLKEQDLGRSGIVSPQSAAEVGKILGVEMAVFGFVTEFGYKKDDSGLRLKGANIGLGKQSAVVALDVRMVNTSTGEIMVAENVRKTKNGISGGVSMKQFAFKNNQSFNESLVGKVCRSAVEKVVKLINDNSSNIPWEAKVITMQDNKVYINSGKNDGITVGESFKVFRQGEALIDPDTGLNLGSVTTEVGMIKVIDNQVGEGKASICKVVSGERFSKGDIVKMK